MILATPGMQDKAVSGPSQNPKLTYRDAGVDRVAAAGAKKRIRALVRSTFTENVVGDIGSFGGGFRLSVGDSNAVLVASADGVGTKLKIAVMAGDYEGVGYDIVAHCADDILTQGGFRRSQNIAYRPACERCRACVSVRILVDEFSEDDLRAAMPAPGQ